MPATEDKLFPVSDTHIPSRSNPSSVSLRAVVITNNPNKYEEFRAQLGDGYGMDMQQWNADATQFDDETLIATCKKIMAEQKFSPHFILREETSLISQKNNEDLTHLPLEQLAKRKLEPVLHTSTLKVIKPQWQNNDNSDEKQLAGLSLRVYEKRSYGYITREANTSCEHSFGWDALFVNGATNLTNEEFYRRYGKKSARQHTVSDFIETYLRYKALISLKHHKMPITRPIEFGKNFFHMARFVREEKHFANPHINDWGIEALRTAMINEGIFIKSAWSRVVKNYFSPPFSGLPLTAKKDQAEETIFMTHDTLHHLVCDLICDTEPTKENFYIYSAWRMTSEAFTMILADMFYADGLIKSGVDRSCVDSRIYPLFEAVKELCDLSQPTKLLNGYKTGIVRKLLYANVVYALLGDDKEWLEILTPYKGQISEEHAKRLKAYKDHFGKFFIGDNAWTRANFDNMHKQNQPLKEWIDRVGKAQFTNSNIPLLSDVAKHIYSTNYRDVVNAVFKMVFETRVEPFLLNPRVESEPEEVIQSRAFRRFLIGQTSLLTRYPTPLNLDSIKTELFARIKDPQPFSSDEQDEIRSKLEQYIRGLEGLRLMSFDEADNAIDSSPVFPPVYIAYPQMQKKYGSIANCVKVCIEGYENPQLKQPAFGASRNILLAQSSATSSTSTNPAPTSSLADVRIAK